MKNKKQKNNNNNLESICKHISNRELEASKAERESIKFMQCIYMSDKIGKIYKGIVTNVTKYGLFVTIEENGCDGLIKLNNIFDDTYLADVDNYRIKGYNTGNVIKLGDQVSVIINSVNIKEKNIDLNLIKL